MRKKRSFSSEAAQESDGINLTPLIDVVFVVLIMFIIIAPMLEIDRIELAEGTEKKTQETLQDSDPIQIYVKADNTIWIHSRMVSLEELSRLLQQAKREKPFVIPKLFHDKKATFGTYQSIKNLVEQSGFVEMDVILQPS